MTKANLHNRPHRPYSGVSHLLVDPDDDFVRDTGRRTPTRRHSVTRRAEKAYIQTGSERRLKVPLSPQRPSHAAVDPLTQVREAYRLVEEVNKLDAAARKYHPARSETLSVADRLESLPSKYRGRCLSHSDTQLGGARQAHIFQDGFRRMTTSDVGREVNRDRDFAAPRGRGLGLDRDLRYDERDLGDDFARVRLDGRTAQLDQFDDLDVNVFRQRQRRRESLARDTQENIIRGIHKERRHVSPDRFPFIAVSQRRSDGRFDGRGGLGPRGRL